MRLASHRNNLDDEFYEGRRVDNLASTVRWFIRGIGGLLVLLFAWLQVKDVQLGVIIENAEPNTLLRVTLAFYYLCWVGGATFDLNIQQSVYLRDRNAGMIAISAVALLISFGITATVLLFASENKRWFSIALTIFWIVGTIGFWYIQNTIRPMVSDTWKVLRSSENYHRMERLMIVVRYMRGRWQWHRIMMSFIFILIILTLTFLGPFRAALSRLASLMIPDSRVETISGLLPSLAFLIYVAATEGWIWLARLRVKVSLQVLDDLNERFVITPRM